jgi:hypothetical protein
VSASDRRGSRSKSDQETAAYMKKMGITRTTGACPWGCGASIRNGGEHLLTHLNICRGPRG